MREIRMSGSVGRGLRPPYPIAAWRERCGVKLSMHEPLEREGPGEGGRTCHKIE